MKKLTSRQKQAIATRLKIINAAFALCKEYDFDALKVTDICKAADVSVGAFYHHFPSKEDLINNGYKEFDLIVEDRLANIEIDDPYEVIRLLIRLETEFVSDYDYKVTTGVFKNQLTAEMKYIIDKNRFFYRKLLEAVENGLEKRIIVSEMSSEEIADMILRLARGVIYDWCLHQGGYNVTERALKDLDYLLTNFKNK